MIKEIKDNNYIYMINKKQRKYKNKFIFIKSFVFYFKLSVILILMNQTN
jgi:hypothetical protein